MKISTYLLLFFALHSVTVIAQTVINPDGIYLKENVCSGGIKLVSHFDNLKNIRVRIVDSCSRYGKSKSLRTYFIMDSVTKKKVNGVMKTDTFIFSSIRLAKIGEQIKNDTVLKISEYYVNILKNTRLDLYFTDETTGFIFGGYSNSQETIYFLFNTVDAGQHWGYTTLFPKINSQWSGYYLDKESLYMFNKQKGIIVLKAGEGERFFSSKNILFSYTTDSGNTWTNRQIETKHRLIDIVPYYMENGQVTLVVKYKLYTKEGDEIGTQVEVYQSKNFGESFKKLK